MGFVFGSLINRGSLLFFFDWCLSPIGKEIMQTFSPKIPWGRFSNLLWLTSVFTPALTSDQTLYFYNVPHFLVQLVPSELYLYNESITSQFVTVLISGAAAEHATTRKQFNRTLSEFGQIQVFIEIQSLLALWNHTPTQAGFLKVSPMIWLRVYKTKRFLLLYMVLLGFWTWS